MKMLLTTVDPVEVGRGHYTHIKELVEGLERRGVAVTMLFGYMGNPQIHCTGGFIDTGARLIRGDRLEYKIKDFINQYLAICNINSYVRRFGKDYHLIYGRDWILGTLGNRFDAPKISEFNGVTSHLRTYKHVGILDRIYLTLLKNREKRAVRDSSLVLCVSESIRNHLGQAICPGHEHKMRVIDNGVNLDYFQFDTSKFSADRVKICFIGSFSYWHGIEYIVPVLEPILKNHKAVDLVFIGSGPNLDMVRTGLKDHYASGRVRFTGRIPIEEAAKKLSACHVGFSPHKPGVLGAPLKIREYCAGGLALVVSGISGTEFIKKNDLGIVVAPGDIRGFQRAFECLLKDRVGLMEKGRNARRYAEHHLSWHNSVEKVYDACKEMLKSS
ncbi:MAG: glycosyltransferase family 4 protein [Deltaproteobacteria bacterium]|nr:glycosyltransferase family 4 protein [Deltaproteobacteria bacterium]